MWKVIGIPAELNKFLKKAPERETEPEQEILPEGEPEKEPGRGLEGETEPERETEPEEDIVPGRGTLPEREPEEETLPGRGLEGEPERETLPEREIEPERGNLLEEETGTGRESGAEADDPDVTGLAADEDVQDAPQRHSSRHRAPPDRLHYTQLGNPLVSIVQSLFQGLSTAFTETLQSKYVPQSVVLKQV